MSASVTGDRRRASTSTTPSPGDDVGAVTVSGADAAARRGRRRSSRTLLASYVVTVLALVTLNFFLPRIAPGDPISALYTSGSSTYVQDDLQRAKLRAYYGLDKPLGSQYVDYLTGLARGDLGTSIRFHVPVGGLIAERLPRSLLLIGTALLLGTGVGVLAGANAGWRRGRPLDRGLLTAFIAVRNFPSFFLGTILLFVFAVKLGWFPLSGSSTPFASEGPLRSVVDAVHHLVLAAGVLAAEFATGQFLLMRAGMVAELGSNYLLAGRAKRLPDRVLKYRYAARNALLPVVSLAAVQVGAAVTAAILVETVFAYEGIGRLLFESISFRDYPALQGCFLLLTLIVVSANGCAAASGSAGASRAGRPIRRRPAQSDRGRAHDGERGAPRASHRQTDVPGRGGRGGGGALPGRLRRRISDIRARPAPGRRRRGVPLAVRLLARPGLRADELHLRHAAVDGCQRPAVALAGQQGPALERRTDLHLRAA